MNSKTQRNVRRAKTHQKIDALRGAVTRVMPDPKLTKEREPQVLRLRIMVPMEPSVGTVIKFSRI